MPENKKALYKQPVFFCFLLIIAALEFIRMSLVFTFLPSFFPTVGYAQTVVGLVLTVCLLTDNLLKSAAGWMVDYYGPWPVLQLGSCAVFIGVVLLAFFYQYLLILILAAFLIGMGISPTWPGVITGSIKIGGEERRGAIISVISVIWLAGGGLGPVLMGFLINHGDRGSYLTAFSIILAVAVVAIITGALGWINWLKHPRCNRRPSVHLRHKQKIGAIIRELWEIKGLAPGMFIQTISLGMLVPNLLPYATKVLGLTESEYSVILIIGGLVVVAFMVPVGHLVDKVGARRFLVTGFLLAALSLFLISRFGNRDNIWYLAALTGFSYSLIQPAWNSLLTGCIAPEQRGVLMGLFMSIEGLGFAIGPLVGGILGALKSGVGFPFYISGISLSVMAIIYMFYPFRQPHLEEI